MVDNDAGAMNGAQEFLSQLLGKAVLWKALCTKEKLSGTIHQAARPASPHRRVPP